MRVKNFLGAEEIFKLKNLNLLRGLKRLYLTTMTPCKLFKSDFTLNLPPFVRYAEFWFISRVVKKKLQNFSAKYSQPTMFYRILKKGLGMTNIKMRFWWNLVNTMIKKLNSRRSSRPHAIQVLREFLQLPIFAFKQGNFHAKENFLTQIVGRVFF